MSQLLDSLRSASRASPWRESPFRKAPPAAILAGMGYASSSPPRVLARRSAVLAIGAAVLAAAFVFLFGRRDSDRSVERPAAPPAVAAAAAARPGPPAVAGPAVTAAPIQPAVKPPAASPAPSPVDRFQRAVALQRAGDFPGAMAIYRKLLAQNELPAQVHNNLGLIHHARGEYDEAVREFEQALRHEPSYPRTLNNLGVTLLAQGRHAAAAERFSAAADLDPRDPDPLVNLALVESATGQPQAALERLLNALALSPVSAPAHYNLAVLYDRSGEAARALEHYRAFLEHGGDGPARAAEVRARMAALGADR